MGARFCRKKRTLPYCSQALTSMFFPSRPISVFDAVSAPCGLARNPARCCNRPEGMKLHAMLSLALVTALGVAGAEVSPSQSPSAVPSTGEMEEPALPTSEGNPSNSEPSLLPESGQLPAGPSAKVPAKFSSTQASPKRLAEIDERFDRIRSLAMSNPRANYLLKRARNSSNSASRRTYLRAYYMTLASRMRRLDPKLKSYIDAYEEARIHEVSPGRALPARAGSHRRSVHRTTSREVHRRSHAVFSGYRYRRMMIIDDRYGPELSPYGPPPFFYPW
jgi:hypothetical protein